MSDLFNNDAKDEELEAILREARGEEAAAKTDEEPSKSWSLDDIDRLIASANGEEYVPQEPKKDTVSEKFKRFFPEEFDESLFTVQPITEEKPEMQDISSGDAPEVEGQETFFEDEEENFSFDMDTSVLPDDIPETPEIKYKNKKQQADPLPPVIAEPEKPEETSENAETEAPAETVEGKEKAPVDYRAMFFKKLKLEDVEEAEEAEPEGPVDISGIVVRKSEDEGEGGLDPLPKVMAAEDFKEVNDEKTKMFPIDAPETKAEKENNDVEGQIVLTGFVDVPEESIPEQSAEQDVEQNLSTRRKMKAKVFKLDDFEDDDFGEGFDELDETDDEEEPEIEPEPVKEVNGASLVETVGEYEDVEDKNKILARLKDRVNKTKKNFMIIGIINAVLLILAFIPPISDTLSIESAIFGRESLVLCVINALLIIGAAALNSEKFFDSLSALIKGKISRDTVTSLAIIVALFENALSAITEASVAVFGAVAVFGILVDKFTDYIDARRILSNFQVCAFNYEHNMYAVHQFDNESEVFELGRGLLMGNAEMLYSSNTEFPDEFIANSEKQGESEKNLKLMTVIGAAASVVAGIIVGIVSKGFMMGFAAFAGAFCLVMPIFGKFVPSFITFITDKRLNHEGTVITGLEAAEKAANANAVVLDSADIFNRSACTMHGMKEFNTMRIDVVLLYAAAMVIKSGGPLKECFEKVIDGRQDLLPPVRELVYEDKMGISARIYEQKVLLGNRSMLAHHNIKVPDKAYEDKYTHNGRKAIYLACNEQLAAMFVVSYRVDETIKGYLKLLESNGIQILVRTNDVNVTEEMISEKFGLKQENFKILSSVAGRLFKRRKDAVIDRLPAEIIHDGKASSMLKAVASACTMASKSKIAGVIQIALMVIGIIFATVIGCSSDYGFTAAWAAIIMIVETAGLSGILMLGKK